MGVGADIESLCYDFGCDFRVSFKSCQTQRFVYCLSIAGLLFLYFSQSPFFLNLSFRGLKYVAKNRTERIQAIARFLADSDHDIVALQEIWVFADYEHVLESVSKRLPNSKFFYRFDMFPHFPS